jgi:hypothetical protein
MTRKTKAFWLSVVLGAVIAVALAEENWLMAAIAGAAIVVTLWIFVHAYPRDLAPPADRRHENTLRRKAGLKPH